jgi:hypothetical protein
MNNDMINLPLVTEKPPDADILREMISLRPSG